jgi:hypothetical protein
MARNDISGHPAEPPHDRGPSITSQGQLAHAVEGLLPVAVKALDEPSRRGYEHFARQLADILATVLCESLEAPVDGRSAERDWSRRTRGLRLVPGPSGDEEATAAGRPTGDVVATGVLRLQVLGRDRVLVRSGRAELALSRRHSEILVLLAAHPGGMTSEQLALSLYGEQGKPQTARAEVSRLRRLLGGRIQTDPYDLGAQVWWDVGEVQRLLRDGRVDDATALYRGPLLPRSDAPGVADLRDELDDWTRRAAVTCDNAEALWNWLNTPSGQDDIPAWKRLLTIIPHNDGRRALAGARLDRLRPQFAVADHDIAEQSGGGPEAGVSGGEALTR